MAFPWCSIWIFGFILLSKYICLWLESGYGLLSRMHTFAQECIQHEKVMLIILI